MKMQNLRFLPVFVIVFCYCTITNAQFKLIPDTCCVSTLRKQGIRNLPAESLTREFKRLRKLKSGCCKNWNSDLHQIMSRFIDLLGADGTDIALIKKYMGKPDADENNIPDGVLEKKPDEKILVYLWRGYHDFVYFVYKENKVRYSKWYMAYE